MTVVYLIVMFAIISFVPALFIPADANTPADPFNTPEHIRPEWYFLAPYEMLKLIPNRFLGIALQLVLDGFYPLAFYGYNQRNTTS